MLLNNIVKPLPVLNQKSIRLSILDRDHVCRDCGKSFSQEGNMKRHVKSHQGIKDQKCHMCGMLLSDKSALKRHMKFPHFSCGRCGMGFSRKYVFRNHYRSCIDMATEDKYQDDVKAEVNDSAEVTRSKTEDESIASYQMANVEENKEAEIKLDPIPTNYPTSDVADAQIFGNKVGEQLKIELDPIATDELTQYHSIFENMPWEESSVDNKEAVSLIRNVATRELSDINMKGVVSEEEERKPKVDLKLNPFVIDFPQDYPIKMGELSEQEKKALATPLSLKKFDSSQPLGKDNACKGCKRKFSDKRGLRRHQEIAHKCERCAMTFCRRTILREHEKSVHEGKQCKGCKWDFSDKQALSRHREIKHRPSCQKNILRSHKSLHKSIDNVCNGCKRIFSDKRGLRRHQEIEHWCGACNMSFCKKKILRKHERSFHYGSLCQVCKRAFSDKKALARHREIVHRC